MPGSKSDYAEKVVLDLFLGGVPWAPPGTLYLVLSTAAYSDAATGASCSEVSNNNTGYARFAVANNATNWPAATGSSPTTKANGTAMTFPAATGTWGTVVSFYVVDALTGGNILYGGDLTQSKQILTGDTATFSQASITVSED